MMGRGGGHFRMTGVSPSAPTLVITGALDRKISWRGIPHFVVEMLFVTAHVAGSPATGRAG
jgi:hypothetical protein